jgi:hypothetical protein
MIQAVRTKQSNCQSNKMKNMSPRKLIPIIILTVLIHAFGCQPKTAESDTKAAVTEKQAATPQQLPGSVMEKPYVEQLMRAATNWQLQNMDTIGRFADGQTEPVPDNGWVKGAFFAGVMATYQTTKDPKYLDAAIALGKKNNWEPGERCAFYGTVVPRAPSPSGRPPLGYGKNL